MEGATGTAKTGITSQYSRDCLPEESKAIIWGRRVARIPVEVLQYIFGFCSPSDLCKLRLTCRRFRDVIDGHVWATSLAGGIICRKSDIAKSFNEDAIKDQLFKSIPSFNSYEANLVTSDVLTGFLLSLKKDRSSLDYPAIATHLADIDDADIAKWSVQRLVDAQGVLFKIVLDAVNDDSFRAQRKLCKAIVDADKTRWNARQLTATLDILPRGDLSSDPNSPPGRAFSSVCGAIEKADKTIWNSSQRRETLDVLLNHQSNDFAKPTLKEVCLAMTGNITTWNPQQLTMMLAYLLKARRRLRGCLWYLFDHVCIAITKADKKNWNPGQLTELLDVLFKGNQSDFLIMGARNAVIKAIKAAGKITWDASQLTETLDVLLKGDPFDSLIKSARDDIGETIHKADKKNWDASQSTETLDVLLEVLRVDPSNNGIQVASDGVCEIIHKADKKTWDAQQLTEALDVLLKGNQSSEFIGRARDDICSAMITANSSTCDIKQLLETLDQLPPNSCVDLCRDSVCTDIHKADISQWDIWRLIETLDALLKLAPFISNIRAARDDLCFAILQRDITTTDAAQLIGILEVLPKLRRASASRCVHDVCDSVCLAIHEADKTQWNILWLTGALDGLLQLDPTNSNVQAARDGVCVAILHVDITTTDTAQIIGILVVLFKGLNASPDNDNIHNACNHVCTVIKRADKSAWHVRELRELTETLNFLSGVSRESLLISHLREAIDSVHDSVGIPPDDSKMLNTSNLTETLNSQLQLPINDAVWSALEKVCNDIIMVADKINWDAAQLTVILDLLLRANSSTAEPYRDFRLRVADGALDAVCQVFKRAGIAARDVRQITAMLAVLVNRHPLVGYWQYAHQSLAFAIEIADKRTWAAQQLVGALDVLIKYEQPDHFIRNARDAVFHAIAVADKTTWDAVQLTESLSVMLKADLSDSCVTGARDGAGKAVEIEDKSSWIPMLLIDRLEVLLTLNTASRNAVDSVIACIRTADKKNWKLPELTRSLEDLLKLEAVKSDVYRMNGSVVAGIRTTDKKNCTLPELTRSLEVLLSMDPANTDVQDASNSVCAAIHKVDINPQEARCLIECLSVLLKLTPSIRKVQAAHNHVCTGIMNVYINAWDARLFVEALNLFRASDPFNPCVQNAFTGVCQAICETDLTIMTVPQLTETLDSLLELLRLAPSNSYCQDTRIRFYDAINKTDMARLDISQLTEMLVVLSKERQYGVEIIKAYDRVCGAIEMADESTWDVRQSIDLLVGLLKGALLVESRLRALEGVIAIISSDALTTWEVSQLVEVLCALFNGAPFSGNCIENFQDDVCEAIIKADKATWGAQLLTEAFGVLLHGCQSDRRFKCVLDDVGKAIEEADKTSWDALQFIMVLEALLRDGSSKSFIQDIRESIYSAIELADKTSWNEHELTEILALLLKASSFDSSAHAAHDSICSAIKKADKKLWDAAQLKATVKMLLSGLSQRFGEGVHNRVLSAYNQSRRTPQDAQQIIEMLADLVQYKKNRSKRFVQAVYERFCDAIDQQIPKLSAQVESLVQESSGL